MGCRLNDNEKRWLKNLIEDESITLYPYSRFEVQNGCRTIKESSHMVVFEEILASHDIAREHFYNSEEFANEVGHLLRLLSLNRTAINSLLVAAC